MLDIERYGSRAGADQVWLQENLSRVVFTSLEHAGALGRDTDVQEQGDGLLVLLPPSVDELRALPRLFGGLGAALEQVNRRALSRRRMRLRLGVSQGVTQRGATGWIGTGIIRACRLCDAEPVRDALARAPGLDLAGIMSQDVYQDVVEQRHPGLGPDAFTRVAVTTKDFAGHAWTFAPPPDPDTAPVHRSGPGRARLWSGRTARRMGRSSLGGAAGGTAGAAAGWLLDQWLPEDTAGAVGDGVDEA